MLSCKMDESEWKLNSRLSKENFMELVHRLRPQLAPKPRSFRPDSNTAEKKLVMNLHYFKDQGSLRVTANASVTKHELQSTVDRKCFAMDMRTECVCRYSKVTRLINVSFPPGVKKHECLHESFILRELYTWKFPSRVVSSSLHVLGTRMSSTRMNSSRLQTL